ncbi:MAG: asparagine synthase (glutamine-hydrolyzing) [Betaproteobacteria bacterium RIFCSPLOWO2_02_FULL_65_24]|nr:MAG: asparagine synthase (glutamine-hydrolyzing) [Betaproteobacteria bacterium RIFCSPLOWO2_02_FULL_65_24]
MCGIFGLIDTPWAQSAQRALDAVAPRGPDEAGHWQADGVWLGHRRLSIIDLEGGHQPMVSADGRYVIVFNGEIYNFRELREEMRDQGRRFRTRSDTEVLLEGYAAWGRELLQRLDGMFAFAIWDTHARSLFCARDRMGIKPFFYSTLQGFSFASTLGPFLRLEGFPRHLNFEAIRDYLGFQCIPAPISMVREVCQLPPAGWLLFDAVRVRVESGRFWTIPGAQPDAPSRDECVAAVDGVIAASVKRQLVSDVPLGVFLSGGIDSSLMVHYMAQAHADPLQTFNVRFAQAGFDETRYARAVADRYGTRHHVFDAPDIDGDVFVEAVHALDQPLADPAYVTTSVLARLTRRHVTVAVSGDGGDELFGGYPRYLDRETDHPRSPAKALLRRAVEAGALPGSLLRRTLTGKELLLYRKLDLGPWTVSRKSLAALLTPDALRAARPEQVLRSWQELAGSFSGRWDTDALMRADLWSYLSENCLAKTDRASMAHSLEVRVPLLGNDVLDTVLRWPAAVHFATNGPTLGKALLGELARRHLPEAVWNRPKHGFSVPLGDYFAGAWKAVCERHMTQIAQRAPFLRPDAVEHLWAQALKGRARRLFYGLLVLLVWIEHHPLDA